MGNFFDCVRSRKDPICQRGRRPPFRLDRAISSSSRCAWAANCNGIPRQEVFTGEGAAEANAHLAREMRKPYDYSFVG